VKITQAGGALVVTVQEYAVVNQVLFQGNKKLKDKQLAQIVQLKPRGAYSQAMMQADVEAIQNAYKHVGRDDATVSASVQQLDEDRVNVVYQINEGGRTKIGSINFVGNKAFSDGRLRDVITTKESGLFSFLTRNDIYSEDRLRADEETLRRFYYNHGYADFRVISSTADLDEASNKYTINVTVDEGERYTFGDINVETTIQGVDTSTLKSDVKTHKGSVYKAEDVEDTIIELTEDLAGRGYAFAEVTPRGDRNFETRQINVTYAVDEGPRAYIQRIEIRGNHHTRDYVIRREFDVGEGDAFNQVLIQQAKKRLERLDFFNSVNISTVPGSEPDQVILVVDVVEKPTGEFSIGAGYSTGESSQHGAGFSVEGSISERNFLGRGQYIRLSVAGGRDSRDYTFSFTEPYFLGRRISAGFDIFRRTRIYDYYEREETGGTVRFGLPITDELKTQFAYNISSENYNFGEDASADCTPTPAYGTVNDCQVSEAIADAINGPNWIKSSVSSSLIFDTIDDYKNPHEGIYANVTGEFAGLGGDAKFVSVTARASYYQTLSDQLDLVGLLRVGGGHIESYSGDLRVFDQFESTDTIIRGFEFNGIGPYQDRLDGNGVDHIGGKTYFNASAEAQFPLPILPPSAGMRGAVFADAATLFGTDYTNQVHGADMAWRASVGVGLIWASPFGPLRINYAVPVLKEENDEVQNFSFGISTRF
jgi:outer membrane protein insertion porin family